MKMIDDCVELKKKPVEPIAHRNRNRIKVNNRKTRKRKRVIDEEHEDEVNKQFLCYLFKFH